MAHARITLVRVVAGAGHHDRAERMARQITNPRYRVEALTLLVGVVAASGDYDRAERLVTTAEQHAREIIDPESRAEELATLVAGIMRLNRSRQPADVPSHEALARRLLTELIGTHSWQIAIHLVAEFDGPALQGICDLVLGTWGQRPTRACS